MDARQQEDILFYLNDTFIKSDLATPHALDAFLRISSFPIQQAPNFLCLVFEAARVGCLPLIEALVGKYRLFVNQPNVRGQTPILAAALANQLHVVAFLMDTLPDSYINYTTPSGDTLLHVLCSLPASETKNPLVESLIELQKPFVSAVNFLDETPLHLAALSGDLAVVERLLAAGADPLAKNKRSYDVFHYALTGGNRDVVDRIASITGQRRVVDATEHPTQTGSPRFVSGQSGSADDSSDLDAVPVGPVFDEHTPLALFEKFRGYTEHNSNVVSRMVQKVYVSPKHFQRATMRLIKQAFVSTEMLNLPNTYSRDTKYRIISLDGGGIKVLMELIILRRLVAENPFKDLFRQTNLFCGVSASSVVGVCLSLGYSIDGLIALVEHVIRFSFKKRSVESVTTSKYSSTYLSVFGSTAFSNLRIKDLPRHVLIPAFLLDNKSPTQRTADARVFTNIVPGTDNELVADVCMRSAAAPSYYAPYQNYVDGGVVDNCPVGLAWPYLLGERGLNLNKENVVCLSISAGRPTPAFIDGEKIGGGGLVQWAPNLVDMFMLARRTATEQQAELLLGERFLRVDPVLPSHIDLDNVEDIDTVKAIAESYNLEPIRKWLLDYWL